MRGNQWSPFFFFFLSICLFTPLSGCRARGDALLCGETEKEEESSRRSLPQQFSHLTIFWGARKMFFDSGNIFTRGDKNENNVTVKKNFEVFGKDRLL